MKRSLIILILGLFMIGSSIYDSLADDNTPQGEDETVEGSAYDSDDDESEQGSAYDLDDDKTETDARAPTPTPPVPLTFDQLNEKKDVFEAEKEELEDKRINAQTTLREAEQRRASLEASTATDEQKREADADVATAQRNLTSINTSLETVNSTLSTTESQIQQTFEYKWDRIIERYMQLEDGIEQKRKEIEEKIEGCGECSDKAILNTQLDANYEYLTYLERRRDLDLCQIDPDCYSNQEEIVDRQNLVNLQAQKMRDLLKLLTDEEIKRNQEKTFNVSGVFNLEGQKPRILSIQGVVNTIANWLVTLVSSLAVTALIIGGFMMIISGGDENRLETGKTIFIYSLIGLTVTLLSFGIITFIQSLFY